MNDLSKSILKKIENLYSKIEKQKNLIILYELLFNQNHKKKYVAIFHIQIVINNCLQYGNYRRACLYILIAENLLNDFEKNKHMLKNQLTNYFVKD